ncbi:MAG: hypothetical protein BWZ10_01371 [candidate division BRC1 bacterium ADurb.BinA364]|nr:MAG: hypothetical protein BWZ10_01371 [candidate division BRC1 bacterium ADurb.BinA364]
MAAWGFNTIGWAQEVVVRDDCQAERHVMHRHSRNWTFEEYQWADMPYCHLLPFAETHQWEVETRYPEVFSQAFEDWCDYVARDQCARMADDPKLIGYFYVDCPSWAHAPKWNPKGPWFDPESLKTESGRAELARTARRYYRTTHDAIRRYDANHLIFGDRYEGKALVPDEVLLAAAPYIDALSFQYFDAPGRICSDFERWHKLTGKPVLLADACAPGRKPENYGPMIKALRELPCCIGWHVCGAYLCNRCRKYGFRDERNEAIEPLATLATQANRETLDWLKTIRRNEERPRA